MCKNPKIDLIKAFMQLEGKCILTGIWFNKKDGIQSTGYYQFTGYYNDTGERAKIIMDKSQVELLEDCNTVEDIYKCYKEMRYF